jgi:peptidyl-prolyl cis-trans isomerase C
MKLRHAVSIVMTAGTLTMGCTRQPSDPVLATVGDAKITLATYRQAYQALAGDKPDLSDPEKKKSFLRDLINKQLLETEAYRMAPQMDDGMRRRLHRFAEGQLLQFVTKREVNDKVAVTDENLKAIWDRMDREIKARHILARSEPEIRELLAQIKGGKSFEDVAKESSFDTKTGEQGGDLGWVAAGQMVEPFDKALFNLKKGEMSEPVKSSFGWHLILAEDVRPVQRPDFESMKERMRMNLLQQRMATAQEQFNASLAEKAKPENQLATIELIDRKFTFELPPDKASDPYAKFNASRNIPSFTAEELVMPVVKFADRPDFTIKDFNEALGWMPPGVWPDGTGTDVVEDLIRQMMRTKLYKERAMELGLHKDPEYVAQIKKKESEMRVNTLYYNGIVQQIKLSDSDLRDFFEKHRENYKVLERTVQARIETADSALAARAADLWKSGRKFAPVKVMVVQADPAAVAVERSLEIPRGAEPAVDELLYNGPPGDVVGPVFVASSKDANGVPQPARWVVAQALDREPERFMTFQEASGYVADHAKAATAEDRLKQLLQDLEKRYPVTVNDKALNEVTPELLNAAPARPTT